MSKHSTLTLIIGFRRRNRARHDRKRPHRLLCRVRQDRQRHPVARPTLWKAPRLRIRRLRRRVLRRSRVRQEVPPDWRQDGRGQAGAAAGAGQEPRPRRRRPGVGPFRATQQDGSPVRTSPRAVCIIACSTDSPRRAQPAASGLHQRGAVDRLRAAAEHGPPAAADRAHEHEQLRVAAVPAGKRVPRPHPAAAVSAASGVPLPYAARAPVLGRGRATPIQLWDTARSRRPVATAVPLFHSRASPSGWGLVRGDDSAGLAVYRGRAAARPSSCDGRFAQNGLQRQQYPTLESIFVEVDHYVLFKV